MSRPTLTLTRATPRTKPSLSMVKKALRQFRGKDIPKAVYRRNAMKWLKAVAMLGDKHILRKGAPAKWGQPGEPQVDQIFAPRRMKGNA